MRNWWVRVAWTAWLVSVLGVAPAYASGPFEKLARGTTNVVTGWLELPSQITRTTEVEGSAAGLSVGVIRGIGRVIGRTTTGVYEMLTFLLANYPRRGSRDPYGAIFEPEFIVFRDADKS